MQLPYLTANLAGTGGVLKQTPEDFVVEEIPLYSACGEGEHVFALLKKRGIATFEAVRRIADSLKIPERYVTFAGLKDARAVTTQWISVFGATEEQVAAIRPPAMEISHIRRHTNRLRVGHHRGNRFAIIVRDATPGYDETVRAIAAELLQRGVPNFFGEQRFGTRGDSYLYGRALLDGEPEEVLAKLLGGEPGRTLDPRVLESRRLFNEKKYPEAYDALPIRNRIEKKALGALVRFGDAETAVRAIPKRMRQMYVSSYQSWLFNGIVADRVQGIDRIEMGDLAYLHRTGRVFSVEELVETQARCSAFEISPSGPIFGSRTTEAGGEPGIREEAVLAETGLTRSSFKEQHGLRLKGSRRAVRFGLQNFEYEPIDETSYCLRFELPPGCFATVALREFQKPAPTVPDSSGSTKG